MSATFRFGLLEPYYTAFGASMVHVLSMETAVELGNAYPFLNSLQAAGTVCLADEARCRVCGTGTGGCENAALVYMDLVIDEDGLFASGTIVSDRNTSTSGVVPGGNMSTAGNRTSIPIIDFYEAVSGTEVAPATREWFEIFANMELTASLRLGLFDGEENTTDYMMAISLDAALAREQLPANGTAGNGTADAGTALVNVGCGGCGA